MVVEVDMKGEYTKMKRKKFFIRIENNGNKLKIKTRLNEFIEER